MALPSYPVRIPGGPLLVGSLLLGFSAWATVALRADSGARAASLGPGITLAVGLALILLTHWGWLPSKGLRAKFAAGLCMLLAGFVASNGVALKYAPPRPQTTAPGRPEVVDRPLQRAARQRDCSADWLKRGAAARCVGAGKTLRFARSGRNPSPASIQRLSPEDIQRLAPPPPRLLDGYLEMVTSLRARLLRRMKSLPTGELEALMGALLLGDRSKLDHETKDLFTRTGTRHLLALSGLHLAILFGVLALPLLRLVLRRFTGPSGRIVVVLGVTLALGLFVPLAGGAPSLWRASFAAGLGFLAPLRGRTGQVVPRTDGYALLGLALIWEVLSDPEALSQPGVQLTYLATFGLLGAKGLFKSKPRPLLPPAPHQRLPLLRAWLGRIPVYFLAGLRASLVASAATLPVLWWSFGETAPIGLLATPLTTPIISVLLLMGAFCLISPQGLAAHFAEILRQGMVYLLQVLDGLPLTPLNLPPRPMALVILLGVLALLALRKVPLTTRPALCLAGILLLPWARRSGHVRLQVLDVGHGTAAVLEVPGMGLLVFDGGSRDRIGVTRALQKVLWAKEADRVTYLTSHSDRDHMGALPWLSQRFQAKQWWGYLPPEIPREILHGAHLDSSEGRLLLYQDPNTRLEMVRGSALEGNEGSRSLIVHARGETLILWGDAEDWGAQATLTHCTADSPVDLLLLPHHGRAGSALEEVLDRLAPRRAWASSSDGELLAEEALALRQIPLEVTTEGPLFWPFAQEEDLPPLVHGKAGPKTPDSDP